MKGFEPIKARRTKVPEADTKEALKLIAKYFAEPADSQQDCDTVVQAIVVTHDPKDKRLGAKWEPSGRDTTYASGSAID